MNQLEQYDRRNNLIFSGIANNASNNDLKKTLTAALSNVNVQMTKNRAETCHRIEQFKQKLKEDSHPFVHNVFGLENI